METFGQEVKSKASFPDQKNTKFKIRFDQRGIRRIKGCP